MKSGSKRLIVMAAMLALPGCSTLNGAQDSALASSVPTVATGTYARNAMITAFHTTATTEAAKVLYRAQVAALFMEAIDENYDRFSSGIFREGVELNLGFDTAIIGLSTIATLESGAAEELAAVIGATAGLESSVDKNLYFDRTMPALIAVMDARRTRVETEILSRLRLSSSEYPVEMLLRDLRRYQQAGTLFRAVVDVTAEATEERQDAEADQQRQFESDHAYACVPEDDQTQQLGPLMAQLRADYTAATAPAGDTTAATRIRMLAVITGADPAPALDVVRQSIVDKLADEICSTEQLERVITRFNALMGR